MNDSGKQDRLREIKEGKAGIKYVTMIDQQWLIDQLELAWRVNAVAREFMTGVDFHTAQFAGVAGNQELFEQYKKALTQIEEIEKGMK